MDFVEELHLWREIPLAGGETEQGGIRIEADFSDAKGMLDSAYDFLRRLKSPPFTLRTEQCVTDCFEEYILTMAPGFCRIAANDTEGIRRGIYKVSELLREMTPSEFPAKEERFHPYFRLRMSRYRFGSHKYPGTKYELDEDSDFYPDAFLDRLASEGINAVWFNAPRISNFCLTPWTPDDVAGKKRLWAKLQDNVDRCKRYGIKLFPYLVIPEAWKFDDPLLKDFPDLAGPSINGIKFFCPAFDGKKYLYDCFHQLFSTVKGLGGLLAIVQGEGAAVCPEFLTYGSIPCNAKCGLSAGKILASGFEALFRGIRSADPEAELIAWFYLPFMEKVPFYVDEALREAPKGILFQYNAESGSSPVQLGKKRKIGDYWQCITEPSPGYREFAEMALRHGHRLSAKIQVGTSHEIGSVPYVPAPALTYRKYKALHALGTTDVMQVWGTGGTPGMMNFTAGRLAFTDMEKISEDEFLSDLARNLWGKNLAEKVVNAWKILSEAFRNYPYSNMIQYFGPVADGVNWPLYAYPVHMPLYPTWGVNNGKISGDNVCECLDNHTLDEVVTLFQLLSEQWTEGAEIFRRIAEEYPLDSLQQREIIRIEALEIHFATAFRIMHFYQLRNRLFSEDAEASHGIVSEMRKLVESEIATRNKMLHLIELEPVLGYNPEAKGFKYDSESILRGLESLKKTLDDLNQIEKCGAEPPLEKAFYFLNGEEVRMKEFVWSASTNGNLLKIHVFCPDVKKVLDELFFAFDDGGFHPPVHGHVDSGGRIFVLPETMKCVIENHDNSWTTTLVIPQDALPGKSFRKCRFNLLRLMDSYSHRCSWPGLTDEILPPRLNMAFYNPADMGRLIHIT